MESMKFRSIDLHCEMCIHDCNNTYVGENICQMFKEKPSDEEIKLINNKIKEKRINLKRLCKGYYMSDKKIKLDLSRLKRMLNRKLDFDHRYLTVIKSVTSKDSWIDDYISKHGCNLNDGNHWDTCYLIDKQ